MYGILITPDTSTKAKAFLEALAQANPEVRRMESYHPCDVLVLYGLGGATRMDAAKKHRALGKNVIAWDLPYWDRDGRTFRMSVNGNHPATVMSGEMPDSARFNSKHIELGSAANPDGPVMIVGHGPKSNAVGADGWARRKIKEVSRALPNKEIIYRPKPRRPVEKGCELLPQSTGLIDEALQGISLVVCRHSNVAVDACRLGVPVVCEDGAAASIYPNQLSDKNNQPSEATRLEFLQRLAWWQYSMDEARLAWQWMDYALTLGVGSGSRMAITI